MRGPDIMTTQGMPQWLEVDAARQAIHRRLHTTDIRMVNFDDFVEDIDHADMPPLEDIDHADMPPLEDIDYADMPPLVDDERPAAEGTPTSHVVVDGAPTSHPSWLYGAMASASTDRSK